jgi:hypothetical protein
VLLPELLLRLLPLYLSLLYALHQFQLLLLIGKQVSVDQHFPLDVLLFLHSSQLHAVLPEAVLPALFDVSDALHGLDSLHVEVAVVLDGLITFFLELEDGVLDDLFVVEFATGLGPG